MRRTLFSRFAWGLMASGVTAAMAAATAPAAPASAAPAPAAAALSCKTPQKGGSLLAGGPVVYDPASAYEELYGVSTNGELYQKVWERANQPAPGWSKWKDLNGDITNTPSAVYDATNDTLDVFARGIDGGLYVKFWCPGHDWQPWQDLGGDITGSPAAIYDPLTGKVEVYTDNAADGSVGEYSGDTLNGFTFTNLGGDITGTPSPVYDSTLGQMEVYIHGINGPLFQQVPASSPNWNLLGDGADITGNPAAVLDGANTDLEVYANQPGTSTTLDEIAFDHGWGSWGSLDGSVVGSPSAVYTPGDGPMDVFDLGVNGPLFVKSGNGNGTWSTWTDLGGNALTGNPAGIDDPVSGYLEAFALTSAGTVFHAYHDDSGWESETLLTVGPSNSTVILAWL
jgi:hypothetical protein